MIILLAIVFATSAAAAPPPQPSAEHFPVADNAPLSWNTGPYSYDASGNVTAIGSQYFLYDTTSRLTSAHVVSLNSAVTQTYAYDVYGNMTSISGYGQDELLPTETSTNHVMLNGAQYDEAGNLYQWQPSGTSVLYKYDYDAVGALTGLRTGPDDHPYTIKYIYTADDQRLWTEDLSANHSHFTVRDLGGAVLSDFDLSGTSWSLSRDYIYREGAMLASTSPSGALYYSLDHLGTPRLISDDHGYVAAFQTFLPYGQEIAPKPLADGAVKKFTGHERDADPAGIGNPLDYMHARYYDGVAGRFLAFDPEFDLAAILENPQMWNRYAYVIDNPLRYTDPNGLATRELSEADLTKLAKDVVASMHGKADPLRMANMLIAKATKGGSFKASGTALRGALSKAGITLTGKAKTALDKIKSINVDVGKSGDQRVRVETGGFSLAITKGLTVSVGGKVEATVSSSITEMHVTDLSGITADGSRVTGIDAQTVPGVTKGTIGIRPTVHAHGLMLIPIKIDFDPIQIH
jgi:RHS repeat-associated protein